MKAVFNNVIIAESDETIVLEGNHYFPPQSLKMEYFMASDYETICPWKGTASYYSVTVKGEIRDFAAWYYKSPMEASIKIKGYVAFAKGVRVVE